MYSWELETRYEKATELYEAVSELKTLDEHLKLAEKNYKERKDEADAEEKLEFLNQAKAAFDSQMLEVNRVNQLFRQTVGLDVKEEGEADADDKEKGGADVDLDGKDKRKILESVGGDDLAKKKRED